MRIDDKEIPDQMLQSYMDEQRRHSYNAGCEAMTKSLLPMILKGTEEVESCRREISNLKRQVTRLKNKLRGISPITISILPTVSPESFRTRFIKFLMTELSCPYYNNCKESAANEAADFCEDCPKKYIGWELSKDTAEAIADEAVKLFRLNSTTDSSEVITAEELLQMIQKNLQIIAPRASGKCFSIGLLNLFQRIARAEQTLGDVSVPAGTDEIRNL